MGYSGADLEPEKVDIYFESEAGKLKIVENGKATDYSEEYTKLVEATSPNKVAALTEVGYIPDIHLLEKSHTPWAYYMTWSEEFCIGEKFNSNENLKAMYDSQYAVTGK